MTQHQHEINMQKVEAMKNALIKSIALFEDAGESIFYNLGNKCRQKLVKFFYETGIGVLHWSTYNEDEDTATLSFATSSRMISPGAIGGYVEFSFLSFDASNENDYIDDNIIIDRIDPNFGFNHNTLKEFKEALNKVNESLELGKEYAKANF